MQTQAAPGIPLVWTVAFCLVAWFSGATFGYGLKELRRRIQAQRKPASSSRRPSLLALSQADTSSVQRRYGERLAPEPPAWTLHAPTQPRRRKRHYRRGGGYYFSEETRAWGDGRWRRRAAWATAALIVLMLGGSVMFAASTYKPSRPAAPGLRH